MHLERRLVTIRWSASLTIVTETVYRKQLRVV
jgi:hypothetical protein